MFRKILFLLVLTISTYTVFAQKNTEKYHRAKIFYKSAENFQKLLNLGLPLDHGKHKKDFFIESDFSDSHIKAAKDIGIDVEVIIKDVQQFYIDQNNPKHKSFVPKELKNFSCTNTGTSYTTPVNYNNGSMGGFLTYAEMLQELDDMQALYPSLISIRNNVSTFTTSEGRALQYVKISDNPSTDEVSTESQVLYTAIHHAREPASLQQLIFYMWYLLENYNTNNEIKTILDNTELFFIPCVNPDGYVYNNTNSPSGGGMWRKNRRNNGGSTGVDNNRNYSYITPGGTEVWNTSGTTGPSGDAYAGTSIFSEPENEAIRWMVEQHDFKVALNAHTSGNLLLYPYGYATSTLTDDDATFQAISNLMVSENGFTNQISANLYPAAGDSDDFMYGMLDKVGGGTRNKIFAMTPEIGPSFWPAESQIIDICKSMIFLNLTAAQITGNYATIADDSAFFIPNTSTNIQYNIQRLGLVSPANFTVSVNPISANIISVGASNAHNNLTITEVQSGNIALNLSPSINTGDDVTYELIVNNGVYDSKIIISKKFGSTISILDEPAEDTNTYWNTTSWDNSSTEYFTANSSITDSPFGNYSNNQDKSIQLTNQLDLTTATHAILSFYSKWNIENDYDYVQVEVSTDNGSSWIPQCGKYTNNGVSDQTGANNEPVYDGVQNTWVLEEIDLSDYLGNNILIRFHLVTDGGATRDGFYFDELTVKVIDTVLSTDDFITNNFTVFPNPSKNTFNIGTNLTNYNYSLYNTLGQLISHQSNNSQETTIDGSNLSTGIYLLEIQHKTHKKIIKLLKE